MTEQPYLTVCLVTPGGVVTRPFSDGTHLVMRSCVGFLQSDEDGLLAEMCAGREPVPWSSREARDDALNEIDRRGDLDDATRADLLAWVEGTPWYEE